MTIRRKTGGSFDFVAPHNELEPLENKLGRHAKIGPSRNDKNITVFEANFEKQTLEIKYKPSLIQRIKRFFEWKKLCLSKPTFSTFLLQQPCFHKRQA